MRLQGKRSKLGWGWEMGMDDERLKDRIKG